MVLQFMIIHFFENTVRTFSIIDWLHNDIDFIHAIDFIDAITKKSIHKT